MSQGFKSLAVVATGARSQFLQLSLLEVRAIASRNLVVRSRFVYSPGKVTVRGLAVLKAEQQLENLINYLSKMQGALPEAA